MRGLSGSEAGVSLVELLLAMTLSALLVVAVSNSVIYLLHVSALSDDRAELNERAGFLLAFFEAVVADVQPNGVLAAGGMTSFEASICDAPQPPSKGVIRVVDLATLDCVSATHAIEGASALMIDTAREQWQRRLFYLRQYAWVPGDGLGALMVKSFQATGGGFGRAEMLLPGVVVWQLEQPDPSGVRMRLLLRGWRKDKRITRAQRAPLVRQWLTDLSAVGSFSHGPYKGGTLGAASLREIPLQAVAVTLATAQ